MTFAQGQIILNAYYALDFYPFLRTRKPVPTLSVQETEAMLEQIRKAKDELFAQGHSFPNVKNLELGFLPGASHARDIVVVLSAILAEGRQDPLNVQPLIGARLEEIDVLIGRLEAHAEVEKKKRK